MLGKRKNSIIERCKAILNKPLKNVFDLYNKFYIFECLNDYSHEF